MGKERGLEKDNHLMGSLLPITISFGDFPLWERAPHFPYVSLHCSTSWASAAYLAVCNGGQGAAGPRTILCTPSHQARYDMPRLQKPVIHSVGIFLKVLVNGGGVCVCVCVGLTLPSGKHFIGQAYADDSLFMPRNHSDDVEPIMRTLHLFGMAAGLHINFRKSRLLSLTEYDWHRLLWPGEIVPPHIIVRHLGYPLGWNVSAAQKLD